MSIYGPAASPRAMTPEERAEARLDNLTDHLSGLGHEYAYARHGGLADELYAWEQLHTGLHERGDLAVRHGRRNIRAELR